MRLIFSALLSQALMATTTAADCGAEMATVFAERVANAYQSGSLSTLDAVHLTQGSIKVAIEHSISDEHSSFVLVKTFSELADLLSAKKVDGFPVAAIWPLIKCSDAACDFGEDSVSIVHNHLFLRRIEYRCEGGAVLATNITFIDGD